MRKLWPSSVTSTYLYLFASSSSFLMIRQFFLFFEPWPSPPPYCYNRFLTRIGNWFRCLDKIGFLTNFGYAKPKATTCISWVKYLQIIKKTHLLFSSLNSRTKADRFIRHMKSSHVPGLHCCPGLCPPGACPGVHPWIRGEVSPQCTSFALASHEIWSYWTVSYDSS